MVSDLLADLRPILDGQVERTADDLLLTPAMSTWTRIGRSPPVGRGIIHQDGPWTWWSDAERAATWIVDGVCCAADRLHGHVLDAARGMAGAHPGGRVLCVGSEVVALALDGLGSEVLSASAWRDDAPTAWADLVVVVAPGSGDAGWASYTRERSSALQAVQRDVLAKAVAAVHPGGAVVYATMSVVPAETQAIAHTVPGWRLRGESLVWPDGLSRGGYVAVLVR
jgi:hypothetical protein